MRLLIVPIAALFLAVSAPGSDTSIAGVVKDSDGALVVGEPVIITNSATHKSVKARTNDAGVFGPVVLEDGIYKIKINARCFRLYSNTVTIRKGQSVSLDIGLARSCAKDTNVE